jgi:stress-induced-phosphoprotein 1
VRRTIAKINEGQREGKDEERMERAMADPEIQRLLSDPSVKHALDTIEKDPSAARRIFESADVGPKLNKLIAAGVLRTS